MECRLAKSVKMATNVSQDAAVKERAIVSWRNKNEAAKKGEILREVQKLKVQIQAMEREKSTHIYSKRSEFRHDFSQLEEMDTRHTNDQKAEHVRLRQQLEKISHMVKRFHKELRDVKPTPEFVEKLKMIMEEIETTINAFKEQQRHLYEEILMEERTTWLEIQAMDKKFDSWSQLAAADSSLGKPTTKPKPLASARDITKDLPPEVAAFEKFVEQNGGVRGGWDEYDHQTFLKIRQKYQGRSVFLQHVLPAVPTRTEEEIRGHEEWYQEYLFLNETKKDAIKKWRDRREEEKEEFRAKATEEKPGEPEDGERQEQRRQQMDAERRERRSKLNSWKVQKELERAQEEERKLRQQLEKREKQDEWKKRQVEMKQEVETHRRQKQEEEAFIKHQEALWEADERERQKQVSAREIAKFRQRDLHVLHDKLERDRAKEQAEREKEKRLERLKSQVEVEVDRDPDRLLRPTEGVRQRARDKTTSGGQVLHNHMPHRAVPAWRQGP